MIGVPGRRLARAAGLLALSVAVGCGPAPREDPPWVGAVRHSLIAVGDTGRNNQPLVAFDRQVGTAMGMAAEHAARPADGLLFLGDNFYFDGLEARTLERQLRANLVRPYCMFLDLSGLLSVRVEGACRLAPEARRPVPVYAILGDHDYKVPESTTLQRELIPYYVANWHMSRADFDVFELGSGLSLVVAESTPYRGTGDFAGLVAALRRAPGPWRILAIHHPPAFKPELVYSQGALAAVRDAGVPVQLLLSGDEHNLQVLAPEGGDPGLHAIAGGGAEGEALEAGRSRHFGIPSQGFARIDLLGPHGEDEGERLMVSFVATPGLPLEYHFAARPRVVARWSVDPEGRIREEPAQP